MEILPYCILDKRTLYTYVHIGVIIVLIIAIIIVTLLRIILLVDGATFMRWISLLDDCVYILLSCEIIAARRDNERD